MIALKINNANQEHKDALLEQQYLIGLQDEFEVNINKLLILDTLLSVQLEAAQDLMQHMHPENVRVDESLFSKLLADGFKDTHAYLPSSGVLNDLINSGQLGLIKNKKLRRIFADWDARISYVKEIEDESKMASFQVVELLRQHGSFRQQMHNEFKALGTGPSSFKQSNASLLNMEIFESSVVYFAGINWRLKNVFYPELKDKMKHVIEIIESETQARIRM